MNSNSDIWFAFARTFSMLFLVLALLILAFYLIKKFSQARGGGEHKNLIRTLSVHHLSPKEKLILVDVLGDKLLIGVTPNNISKIASINQEIGKELEMQADRSASSFQFSDFLAHKIGRSNNKKDDIPLKKEPGE